MRMRTPKTGAMPKGACPRTEDLSLFFENIKKPVNKYMYLYLKIYFIIQLIIIYLSKLHET